jgi:hypothetical protein
LINVELEKMWKLAWPNLRCFSGIFLEGLRKITESSAMIGSIGPIFESGTFSYDTEVLPSRK